MRALGLALLLANVLFFAWSQWLTSDEAPPSAAAPAADVPTLVLAREADEPVNVPSPPDEAPQRVAEARSEPTPAVETPADTGGLMASVARCVSIGPFRDLNEATQGSAALRGSGHDPRTRVAEGEVWAGLWVYLAGLPSRGEAQRAMTLLKQRGITDAYIMPAADRSADISLGIFSEPSRAQKRADDVRALGFTPTIADHARTGQVYWIDVDLAPTAGFINPADIPTEAGKITRLEIKACPSVDP